jgi:predicted ribosome quality control (RQC) complex YloA/Tae2 family protein
MKEINSLEISFLVKSLKRDLVSSKIQKIKQIGENTFLFELYKQKKREFLIISDRTLFLTDKNFESTQITNFFQVLKKHLLNQIIDDVRQHEFDRIVEIETKDYLLIDELFGKGNLILINKTDRKIISASMLRSWKDRSVSPNREYAYPPSRINPLKLNQSELKKYFGEKEAVVVLAVDLGFGGELARNICEKIGIDKESKRINVSEFYKFLKRIHSEFKELENVNEELKEGFEEDLKKTREEKTVDTKSERIKKAQEEALKKWQEKENQYRKIGKLFYERYEDVKEQLDSYKKKITIDGIEIEIDPRKSVQKNAEVYFERAKMAKKKIEGIIKSMQEMKIKRVLKKIEIEHEVQIKRDWYDNFRWITSSDGFLLVGGKDAKTNEKLIRKHMKENDLVFHTDITGSPFVLIKNPEGKEIPEQTIKETAEFCGSYSKAWKIGISAVDVYYIKPDQVKKEGGLPTGSFMIYGKREWIRRIPVRVAVGIKDDEFYFGPEDLVKNKTSNYVTVVPGDTPSHEIVNEIQNKLKTKIGKEKIARIIPYGKGRLSEIFK